MANIFESIPTNIQTEVFENIVDSNNVKIERIISQGHASTPTEWLDEQTNEWVIVLQGEAVLLFDNASSVTLKTGDYINIPAHTKHKVEWTTSDTETIWLAIHY